MPMLRWQRRRAGIGGARPVRATPYRPFGIGDGLILVAATAAGMGLIRSLAPYLTLDYLRDLVAWPATMTAERFFLHWFFTILAICPIPYLITWTPAFLVMRLRPPRPAGRRLVRQPGLMACLAATATGSAVAIATFAGTTAGSKSIHPFEFYSRVMVFGFPPIGAAVAACWATQVLAGRWAPEPTWIDRLGRALGITWLIVAAYFGVMLLVFWPI